MLLAAKLVKTIRVSTEVKAEIPQIKIPGFIIRKSPDYNILAVRQEGKVE